MLSKLSIAAVAAVSLGAAALAPSSASAWGGGFHGGWHGGGHPGWHTGWYHRPYGGYYGPRFYVGGPAYAGGYGGCYVRRLVPTPWGPHWRLVNRCY